MAKNIFYSGLIRISDCINCEIILKLALTLWANFLYICARWNAPTGVE